MSGCFAASPGSITGESCTAKRWKFPVGSGSDRKNVACRAAAVNSRGAAASLRCIASLFRVNARKRLGWISTCRPEDELWPEEAAAAGLGTSCQKSADGSFDWLCEVFLLPFINAVTVKDRAIRTVMTATKNSRDFSDVYKADPRFFMIFLRRELMLLRN